MNSEINSVLCKANLKTENNTGGLHRNKYQHLQGERLVGEGQALFGALEIKSNSSLT